jgi:hypothetical protein
MSVAEVPSISFTRISLDFILFTDFCTLSLISALLLTELKQEMLDPQTTGCKLEERRNVSFSSCRYSIEFYFSEIIIRSNVNLITSNLQLSDTGEVGEV